MGCDIVTFEEKYAGVVNYLLGRICIAQDIDAAAKIAKKYGYKFRIVTLDGQVVNAGGSFTGGSVSKSTGILTRKNEIGDLQSRLEQLRSRSKELKEQKEKLSAEVNKYAADMEGLKDSLNSISNDIVRLEMEINRVEDYRAQYESGIAKAEELAVTLEKKLASAHKELDETAKALTDVDKEILDGEQRLSQSVSKQQDFKNKRGAISEELSQLRIRSAEMVKDIQSCRDSIAQLEESLRSSDSNTDKTELDIVGLKQQIDHKRGEIGRIRERIASSGGEIKALEDRAEKARQEHLEMDEQASKLRSAQKNKINEREELASQLSRLEEKQNSTNEQFDKLVGQLWDEYELTRTTAAETAKPIEDQAQAQKELQSLKNKIKALGSVNLGAIEEYQQVSERYEFMSKQLTDVNTSKEELCSLIDSLTEKMKSVFLQSFESINKNFAQIFSELFGGGKAQLILTDPEDVLECGIEINVQPPGKVITSLMSLSGGEQALAAIAIYFAILKNSPSPFCLLDEIEAALDDVNVTRYAQFLHRLTDKTQFITITHRRGTMEEADVLYGVTMQEKGISKLLRMSVAETAQLSLEQ